MKRITMNILFVALIFFTIFFSLHWFVWKTAVRFLNLSNGDFANNILIGILLLGVSFLPATLLAFRYYNFFTRSFYIISSLWEGFFLYFLAASCGIWILYGISHYSVPFSMKIIGIGMFAAAGAVGIFGIWNASSVRITDISVRLPNLPAQWKNRSAVFISDTHFDQVRSEKSAKKISELVASLHPDVVFIGGDFFDGSATDYAAIAKYFTNISAPLGTFFVTGNHEEFTGNENNAKYLAAIRNAGIKILSNEKITLDGMQIIGVDYENTRDTAQFKKILTDLQITKDAPSILLKHAPDGLEESAASGISLQLSGHTHKGQLFPGGLFTKAIFGEYDYGLHTYKNMAVYTSSGAGTFGPPMRVGTIAEIVRIKFMR